MAVNFRLMGCAFVVYLRLKNSLFKMLPGLTLLVLAAIIALLNYRLLSP